MNKIILTAALLLLTGFSYSQQKDALVIGAKAGMNSTNFTGDVDSDSKTDFYVGATADYAVTKVFHIQPEFLYSREGADRAQLDYARLPIMAKFYVTEGFSIVAGPELAFKVAAENDYLDDLTKTFDFGLGIGAAYEFSNGILLEIRYNKGMSNISKVSGELKNEGAQIGLGYRFL